MHVGEPYDVQPGICVIINNMEFRSGKGLPQGKRDEQSLNLLFASLGFNVKSHQNLTAQLMITTVKSYSEMQHKGVFLLIILSHGTLVDNREAVLGMDDKAVTIDQLETFFCASRCPMLDGVPKIFLVDAFWGGKDFTSELTKTMGTKERLISLLASCFASASYYGTDMLHFIIIYASTFEYVAHLTNSGSWFTRTLVKVITEATPDISFTQIIQEVKERATTHQIVESVDQLTHDYIIKRYCC